MRVQWFVVGLSRAVRGSCSFRSFSFVQSDDPTRVSDISHFPPERIRNFSIVAHVDHGKSTLADRLLELGGAVTSARGTPQLLDKLQVERDRGITVKAQSAALFYKGYLLNLIDTPGHVDFSDEVSRSLTVCDGILLLVAANQGVQAQTISNFWLAFERDVSIIPIINKVDLKGVNIEKVVNQIKNVFDFDSSNILRISAKSGLNVDKIFEQIINNIPSPKVDREAPFRAVIFDSTFDRYRGAIANIFVKDGKLRRGNRIRTYHESREYEVSEVGIMRPDMVPVDALCAGQVGYVICNMKTAKEATVGETLYFANVERNEVQPVSAGYKKANPTLYAGLFPVDIADYEPLSRSLERLCLNDPSVVVTPDSSAALGLGWKVGFLGVLHMEVFTTRLEQEFDANVILTQPSVEYRAIIKDNESIRKKRFGGKGEVRILDPSQFPNETDIEQFLEPMVKVRIIVPLEHMGTVNGLCSEVRGQRGLISSIDNDRMLLTWRIPLAEVVVNFFERLKRLTSGYASFDYEHDGYDETKLVKVTITINGKEVSEFSQIVPAAMARARGKTVVDRLKTEIPRQQFEVTIKACSGSSTKAMAQAVIQPMKRDFSQLLKGNFGGGGMERLNKKLSHQKRGKERLKQIGNIQIPKETFLRVLQN